MSGTERKLMIFTGVTEAEIRNTGNTPGGVKEKTLGNNSSQHKSRNTHQRYFAATVLAFYLLPTEIVTLTMV